MIPCKKIKKNVDVKVSLWIYVHNIKSQYDSVLKQKTKYCGCYNYVVDLCAPNRITI